MREEMQIALIAGIFVLAGLFVFFQGQSYTEFNFHESELAIVSNQVTEKLYFHTDKPYHTLYRDFSNPVYSLVDSPYKINYVEIQNVLCSAGTAYVQNDLYRCTFFEGGVKSGTCLRYTQKNEYGCGFGYNYGFKKGEDYTIETTYTLNPKNLFLINDKYYIKFVVYSKNRHVKLNEKNFFISGPHEQSDSYASNEDVIIYIPFNEDISNYNIISQKNFEYDGNLIENLFALFFSLLPAGIIFLLWRIFGKEKTYEDIPEELSFYPGERNPWEVAAFFQPPFNTLDKNFFATMLINFYHKKVIDIKMKQKDLLVKVNNYKKESLDKIEKYFLEIIEYLFENDPSNDKSEKSFFGGLFSSKSYIESGYLNLNKSLASSRNRPRMLTFFKDLHKDVKDIGKNYIDTKGQTLILVFTLVLLFLGRGLLSIFVGVGTWPILLYVAMFLTVILMGKSPLFIKFNEHYYKEFQRWQAYRKFLKNSFSIQAHGHKGVILWDKILVYATALGVAKEVLKEMKKVGIIDDRNFALYTGIYIGSTSFSASAGPSGGHGGGFGGAGGGGIGGGGGGGR